MKKLVLAFIALMFLLAGCSSEQRNKQRSDTTEYPHQIKEITYKGHDYIIFQGRCSTPYNSGTEAGVVHDPECRKCLNEKQVNNVDSDVPRKVK